MKTATVLSFFLLGFTPTTKSFTSEGLPRGRCSLLFQKVFSNFSADIWNPLSCRLVEKLDECQHLSPKNTEKKWEDNHANNTNPFKNPNSSSPEVCLAKIYGKLYYPDKETFSIDVYSTSQQVYLINAPYHFTFVRSEDLDHVRRLINTPSSIHLSSKDVRAKNFPYSISFPFSLRTTLRRKEGVPILFFDGGAESACGDAVHRLVFIFREERAILTADLDKC